MNSFQSSTGTGRTAAGAETLFSAHGLPEKLVRAAGIPSFRRSESLNDRTLSVAEGAPEGADDEQP